jgi:acyl-CoA thioester hydrolase
MSSVTYKGAVYPWQYDHIGHMNVMWYVGKFDEANWNFLATLGLTPTYFAEQHRGMAAVQQNITYKNELLAGNIVEVRSRALEIGDKSLRLLHEMWNAETQELSASCELTVVHMDRRERKALSFPGHALDQPVVQLRGQSPSCSRRSGCSDRP